MDVFTLLKEDHSKVKKLFKEFEGAGERAFKKKQSIADKVCEELEIHVRLEEEIVYPAIKAKTNEDGRELVNESFEEHTLVKRLIKELKALKTEDEVFDAKFKVLRDVVEHHIEEEEKELFPKAKKDLGYEVQEISSEVEARKLSLEEKTHWPSLF